MTRMYKSFRADVLCGWCRRRLDASGAATEVPGAPRAGDLTICLYCSRWNVYLPSGLLRQATQAEVDETPLTWRQNALAIVQGMNKERPH